MMPEQTAKIHKKTEIASAMGTNIFFLSEKLLNVKKSIITFSNTNRYTNMSNT